MLLGKLQCQSNFFHKLKNITIITEDVAELFKDTNNSIQFPCHSRTKNACVSKQLPACNCKVICEKNTRFHCQCAKLVRHKVQWPTLLRLESHGHSRSTCLFVASSTLTQLLHGVRMVKRPMTHHHSFILYQHADPGDNGTTNNCWWSPLFLSELSNYWSASAIEALVFCCSEAEAFMFICHFITLLWQLLMSLMTIENNLIFWYKQLRVSWRAVESHCWLIFFFCGLIKCLWVDNFYGRAGHIFGA